MIVRIDRSRPKIHLHVKEFGCGGRTLLSACRLQISPVRCEHYERFHTVFDGCSFVQERLPDDRPVIEYPAFEIDDDGNIVFYFDNVFFELPIGRYHAKLLGCGDGVEFQLDLRNAPLRIDKISITERDERC